MDKTEAFALFESHTASYVRLGDMHTQVRRVCAVFFFRIDGERVRKIFTHEGVIPSRKPEGVLYLAGQLGEITNFLTFA